MEQSPGSKVSEIDRNLKAFLRALPAIQVEHAGEYALMHDGRIVAYFATALDAQIAGNQRFEEDRFSFQYVDQTPAELGFYAFALHSRDA